MKSLLFVLFICVLSGDAAGPIRGAHVAPKKDASVAWSETLALEYYAYSLASFCSEASVESWNCAYCSKYGLSGFKATAAFGTFSGDAWGFLGYQEATKQVIVSFRGENSVDLPSWIKTFEGSAPLADFPYVDGSKVYSDFLSMYTSLNAEMFSELGKVYESHEGYTIVFTGHSSGAALATLAAAEVMNRTKATVELWTYASPRVGDAKFTDFVQEKAAASFRHTNDDDICPHYPTEAAGYIHVTEEYWYTTAWKACSTSNPEDPTCSDSVPSSKYSTSDAFTYFGLSWECSGSPSSSSASSSGGSSSSSSTKTSSSGSGSKTSSTSASASKTSSTGGSKSSGGSGGGSKSSGGSGGGSKTNGQSWSSGKSAKSSSWSGGGSGAGSWSSSGGQSGGGSSFGGSSGGGSSFGSSGGGGGGGSSGYYGGSGGGGSSGGGSSYMAEPIQVQKN